MENNLFGVDLNEESVEIAKLSLWLRTAKPNRKLNDLNNNIKCGNSLIDDEAIAGDKAFNWQKEFPQVFGRYVEDEVRIEEQQTTIENINSINYPANQPISTTESSETTNTNIKKNYKCRLQNNKY